MKILFPWITLYCENTRQNFELIWLADGLLYMSSDWSEWYAVPFSTNEFAGQWLMIATDYKQQYNLVEEDGTLNFEYINKKEFKFRNADESVIKFPATI